MLFSVCVGKFGGGNVNVVIKLGINDFYGIVFYEEVFFFGMVKDIKFYDIEYDVDNEEFFYGFILGGLFI